MSTIGERIRMARKDKAIGLTLAEFGKRIGGFSSGTMSAMETGARGVTDQTIMSICREFHVNETWLRTGEGPMFVEPSLNEQITTWIDSILTEEPDSCKVRLVAALSKLDPAGWKALYELAASFVGEAPAELLPKEENIEDGADEEEVDEDEQIEREADVVRESYVQTRRGAVKSSASSIGNGNTA